MQRQPKKLLDQVRHIIRLKHYSMSTEEAYVSWIRRFILFHDKRHPREMGVAEIEAFLTHLAVDQQVAASTQNQALHALLFLYQQVLHKKLDGPISPMRAKRNKHLPTVLTREEALSVIAHLSGTHQLIARILYGSGLRLTECLRLRVKDLDLSRCQVIVRDGKGMKDRIMMLPEAVVPLLEEHLQHDPKHLYEEDVRKDVGFASLPFALDRKYPNAKREWLRMRASVGNTSSLPVSFRSTHAQARCAATTCTKAGHRKPSRQQPTRREFEGVSLAMSSGTLSLRTCWRAATIFARSKSCWATRISKQP